MSASVSPMVIDAGSTNEIEFRLSIKTGGEAERFGLGIEVPRYRTRAAGRMRYEGAPISPVDIPRVDGPAELRPLSEVIGTPACSPTDPRPHGYEPRNAEYELSAPARTESVLVARYRLGDVVPWADSDFRLTFIASPRIAGRPAGTIGERRVIKPPRPRLIGLAGTRIEMWTTPASTPTPARADRAVMRRGARVSVEGRVVPTSPSLRVALKYVRPGSRSLRALAKVRTDSRGRFGYQGWRPRWRGSYEVWAFTPRLSAERQADYMCPLSLSVR